MWQLKLTNSRLNAAESEVRAPRVALLPGVVIGDRRAQDWARNGDRLAAICLVSLLQTLTAPRRSRRRGAREKQVATANAVQEGGHLHPPLQQ